MPRFNSTKITSKKISPSTFYGFFGIIIPYLIIFLLLGEVNLLKLGWNLNGNIDWRLYGIIFGMAPLGIFWSLIGISTKTMKIDSIPFLCSSVMLCIGIFISSLMPNIKGQEWLVVLVRIIIVLLFSLITFFSVNYIVKIIIKKFHAIEFFDKFSKAVEDDQKSNIKFKSVLDTNRRIEEEDSIVEIEEKIKKEK